MNAKKFQDDKAFVLSIIKYILIIIIVIGMLFFSAKLLGLLVPVIIGFVLAHVSNGFSALMYRIFRHKRPRTRGEGGDSKSYRFFKLVNFTILLLIFIGLLIFIIIALIAQVRNLLNFLTISVPTTEIVTNLASWLNKLSKDLGGILPEETINNLIDELTKLQDEIFAAVPQLITVVLGSMLSFLTNLPNIIFKAIVIVMSGYYFITDRAVISKFIRDILPSEVFVNKVIVVITKVSGTLFRVFGGYAIIMTLTFIEAIIGLSIIKMPYIIIIALAVTVIDLLPAVGASTCFYPIAIYMFANGRIFDGIIALCIVGVMTVVRSFLEPKVIGNALKLHPLATLIAMILGVATFGLAGFIGGPVLLIMLLGIMESFGYKEIIKERLSRILNKVAIADIKNDQDNKSTAAIRHIVMWQLKDEALDKTRDQNMLIMKEKLYSLPAKIPQIISFEVGMNKKYESSQYDMILISSFANHEDLEIYREHPAHKEVSQWVRQIISSRNVVDIDI
ncbi:MAG: AI-2E family transporter [Saccharofermentanales bacterium]